MSTNNQKFHMSSARFLGRSLARSLAWLSLTVRVDAAECV